MPARDSEQHVTLQAIFAMLFLAHGNGLNLRRNRAQAFNLDQNAMAAIKSDR